MTGSNTSLFITGNGFDLKHGVSSRYYHFRDSIGRKNLWCSQKNALCIYGDRRDKKTQLVLEHCYDKEEVFEEWYKTNKNRKEFQRRLQDRKGSFYNNYNPIYLGYFLEYKSKGNWKAQMRCNAIHNNVRLIQNYFEKSAKKTREVLGENQSYFKLLECIKEIVAIGHSLSNVDYPYFRDYQKQFE